MENTVPVTPTETVVSAPAPDQKSGFKKLLIIGGGALLLLSIAAAALYYFVLSNNTTSTKPVTLTYWGLWEPAEVMQPIIQQYQQDNPHVTINYEQRPLDQHYSTVKSRIRQAAASGTMPDIIRVHNSWVPIFSNYLSAVPSHSYTREEYEATFYNVTKDSLLLDGKYYGIPLMMDGLALVYNQDLFSKAGISAPPATWDEVRQDAAKIAQRDERGNLEVGGIAMGSSRNVDNFADIIALLMAQNNVVFKDAAGNVTFHQEITSDGRNLGAEALSFYNMFTSTEKTWDESMETSTLAFSKGKVGMILVPSWRVLSLIDQNPQLQIRVAPVPHLTTDQNVGYATYWTEVVPSASPNQAEAWKFLRYLSEREQQLTMFNTAQQARSFGEPYSRKDLASALSGDPILSPYGSQPTGYRSSFFATNTGATEYNEAINQALAEAVASGGNTESAASALEDLALKVSTIIEQERQ